MSEATEQRRAPATQDPKRARRARRDRSTHFVYECYDALGQPLYVGCTSSIAQRFGAHSSKDWWPYVHTIKMTSHPDRARGMLAELDLIRELQPAYNVQATDVGNDAVRSRHAERMSRA